MTRSTVVHEGGGPPSAAELGSRRIIGFCGLATHNVSYATTHAITPTFWAHEAGVSCGIHGCRRKPTSEKCFGCWVQVLCRNHTGIECSKCDTEPVARQHPIRGVQRPVIRVVSLAFSTW